MLKSRIQIKILIELEKLGMIIRLSNWRCQEDIMNSRILVKPWTLCNHLKESSMDCQQDMTLLAEVREVPSSALTLVAKV